MTCPHATVRPYEVTELGTINGRCVRCGERGLPIWEPVSASYVDDPDPELLAPTLRVAVVGSRSLAGNAAARAFVLDFVATLPPVAIVVSGGARGPDQWAADTARRRGLGVAEFWPEYDRLGRGAPFARNEEIAANCDGMLAVWDGVSRGTMDVVGRTRARGVQVRVWRLTPRA